MCMFDMNAELILEMKPEIEDGSTKVFVDLEGDAYADPENSSPIFPFEVSQVVGVTRESDSVIVVYFEGSNPVAVPPTHEFVVTELITD